MKVMLIFWAMLAGGVLAGDLRVVTFNIRYAAGGDTGVRSWSARKAVVAEAVGTMRPDVMGVQEALSHQMTDLQGRLEGYEAYGVGRDDGKRRGEFSPIFYRSERFERDANDSGTFWLSPTPDQAGTKGWGNQVVRICTWVRLVEKDGGRGFYVFNTHWDHQHQGSRERSARLIAERIRMRQHADEPVVLVGDFNATETNPAVAYLVDRAVELEGGPDGLERAGLNLRAAFLQRHPEQKDRRTFHGWKGARQGPHMIDHVLVSPQWTVKEAWIEYFKKGEVWPSDHFPVGAVLGWGK